MNNFLIISLPRSRTAWLSVALTYGNSYCFHEPLLGCESVSDLKKKFDAVQSDVVGGADTGAILFLNAIIKEIPDIRILLIDRNIEDCEASMEAMGFEDVDLSEVKAALDEAASREYVKVVKYEELSDPTVGMEIWQHCVGTNEFNMQRWKDLCKLDIQVNTEQFFQELNYQQASIELLKEEISCG